MSINSNKLGKRCLLRIFRSLRFRSRYFLFCRSRDGITSKNTNAFELDDLLCGVTQENVHPRVNLGPPKGKELL